MVRRLKMKSIFEKAQQIANQMYQLSDIFQVFTILNLKETEEKVEIWSEGSCVLRETKRSTPLEVTVFSDEWNSGHVRTSDPTIQGATTAFHLARTMDNLPLKLANIHTISQYEMNYPSLQQNSPEYLDSSAFFSAGQALHEKWRQKTKGIKTTLLYKKEQFVVMRSDGKTHWTTMYRFYAELESAITNQSFGCSIDYFDSAFIQQFFKEVEKKFLYHSTEMSNPLQLRIGKALQMYSSPANRTDSTLLLCDAQTTARIFSSHLSLHGNPIFANGSGRIQQIVVEGTFCYEPFMHGFLSETYHEAMEDRSHLLQIDGGHHVLDVPVLTTIPSRIYVSTGIRTMRLDREKVRLSWTPYQIFKYSDGKLIPIQSYEISIDLTKLTSSRIHRLGHPCTETIPGTNPMSLTASEWTFFSVPNLSLDISS